MLKICYIGWGHSIHTQRWLKWFAKRGHKIHLITDHPVHLDNVAIHDIRWKTDTRPRYIRYRELGFNIKFIRLFKTILKVRKLVNVINPDILHLHTLYYPSNLGVFTNFHPLVITPWNGDVLWSPRRSMTHRFLVRYTLRNADLIIHNSLQMRDKCIDLGIAKQRLHMIQWTGVDLKSFYPQAKSGEIKERLYLNKSSVVLSTRSISDEYNIDIIVRAIAFVLQKIPETKFIFTWHSCNDDTYSNIKELVDDLNIEDAVRFLGKIEYYESPEYFNLSDVFISISSLDSRPASLLEAMACGVPPITADHPAVNEVVKDGWNAYVVPQRDPEATAQAIIKLLKDEKMRKVFAERNSKWVRKNADYDKNMEKVEELYYRLLSDGR